MRTTTTIATPSNTQHVPTIRLITATPSAAGLSSTEGSTSFASEPSTSSWTSVGPPSPVLLPKASTSSLNPKKRLVPKKSKLSLLGLGTSSKANVSSSPLISPAQSIAKDQDLSDVLRRVGASQSSRRGFEIFVDPTDDPDLGEIVVVRKKKSRAGLDGVRWGETLTPLPLGDKSLNAKPAKESEGAKWWSLGRGRKESKEKTAKSKVKSPLSQIHDENSVPVRFNSTSGTSTAMPILSKTTERSRFNSLDSGVLLATKPAPPSREVPSLSRSSLRAASNPTPAPSILASRSSTPTAGGLLAPPLAHDGIALPPIDNQGSIALRAMRSVRSLARIGGWSKMQDSDVVEEPVVEKKDNKEKDGTMKKKDKKEKKEKESREKKEKKEKREKAQTLRVSTSSFEVGALSPAKPARVPVPDSATDGNAKTLGKKRSTLLGLSIGLGIPSTMRMPSMRSGSNASSVLANSGTNGLFVTTRDRSGSAASGASKNSGMSSLRPLSTSSGISSGYTTGASRISSGSVCSSGSIGASVRWDEQALERRRLEQKLDRAREREAVKELAEKSRVDGKEKSKKGSKKSKSKKEREKEKEKEKEEKRGSRHSSEGRRRTPLSEVFPESLTPPSERPSLEREASTDPIPVWRVNVEEATNDGHDFLDDASLHDKVETPMKRTAGRRRPMSEQLLGSTRPSRPKAMYPGEGESDGVISLLDAATNDLAQLINHLDLEATPGTPDISPLRNSPFLRATICGSPLASANNSPTRSNRLKDDSIQMPESPLKGLRANMASITSLRPYAQSRDLPIRLQKKPSVPASGLVGQQIAPWPVLNQSLSPKRSQEILAPSLSRVASPATITPLRLKHKRALALGSPAPSPEPAPVFQPLHPAKHRLKKLTSGDQDFVEYGNNRAPSSMTFGSHSRSSSARSGSAAPSPVGSVFKKEHTRKKSSLSSSMGLRDAGNGYNSDSMPIPPETKRVLGMTGTMGASVASGYVDAELDASDPDSDIPDELQILLAGQSDLEDTLDFPRSAVTDSSGANSSLNTSLSAAIPVPVFRAQIIHEGEHRETIDIGTESSDGDEDVNDTKKSFDFTGELKELNESGDSDRRSFVEQLENAFRTPAKIALRGFGEGLLQVNVPPMPPLPTVEVLSGTLESETSAGYSSDLELATGSEMIVDMKEPTMMELQTTAPDSLQSLSAFSDSGDIINMHEPTLLHGSDSLDTHEDSQEESGISPSKALKNSSSMGSRPSDGQLNVDFKFGGRPPIAQANEDKRSPKPLTLSDIIPPPSHQRSLSDSAMLDEDDSVLKSIFAQVTDIPAVDGSVQMSRPRLNSDSSSKRLSRDASRMSVASMQHWTHSRPASGISFAGFDSFEEVRRGFEFSGPRPAFYPPPSTAVTRDNRHFRNESFMSIASVSSFGRVLDPGSADPFYYGLPSLRERPSSEEMFTSMSTSIDDTFSFIRRQPPRRRVDSDASSFYFKPSQAQRHRRHESNMSTASQAPPISLYNRSFGHHRRTSSVSSASSVAQSYAKFGPLGGRAVHARHRQEASVDSTMSDFSARRLGRPGLGDKMFDTGIEHGMPLTSISASPPDSSAPERSSYAEKRTSSFDSILDDDPRSSADEDSLFEKTGHRSSISSDSVFGNDCSQPQGHLLQPYQFRPVSMISFASSHEPMHEDDTMISMLGGGHVRRSSIRSIIDASPCVRFERRRKDCGFNYDQSPNKARIVEKPSIASTSSQQFGGERMINAQRGLLERQSLEDSCLIAAGEDSVASLQAIPVFSRPGPPSRSRSSTCTSSSGGDTPPLSASDGSSISGGSQSSIDLSQLNIVLSNATHPMSAIARVRARARARGHGHRRRISEARMSRASVYETIEEEMSAANSPARPASEKTDSPTISQPVFIVESDTVSLAPSARDSITYWDDEQGIGALRKYYALKDEAEVTVTESRRVWADTPFSLFAVQSFHPPDHPAGMQALLEHSVQNYGPLPSELRARRIRSRTQSRASPYPQSRTVQVSITSEQVVEQHRSSNKDIEEPMALRALEVNPNVATVSPVQAKSKARSSASPQAEIELKRENAWGLAPNVRPRVGSTARRSALGWTKRSNGPKSSTGQKENVVGEGSMVMTPGETLRLSRPRPRGRPTPASARPKPIRI